MAFPFLKWVGGKGQLLEKFTRFYPAELNKGEIKNYIEPFVGGGAVFFHVMQNYNVKNAVIADANEELVLMYKVVQQKSKQLIDRLIRLQDKYLVKNDADRKTFYYAVRSDLNNNKEAFEFSKIDTNAVERVSQLVFLNKTGYNGLFRLNRKGLYNVPAGRYKNPKIADCENIKLVSTLLKNTAILHCDYKKALSEVSNSSFVYFDPPYRPINKTSNFTAYSHQVFSDKEQVELASEFSRLNDLGAKLMLSNSDPKNYDKADSFFDDLYRRFNVYRVPARRSVNSNPKKRGIINEILVTNYANE